MARRVILADLGSPGKSLKPCHFPNWGDVLETEVPRLSWPCGVVLGFGKVKKYPIKLSLFSSTPERRTTSGGLELRLDSGIPKIEDGGKISVALKSPWRDGTRHIELTPKPLLDGSTYPPPGWPGCAHRLVTGIGSQPRSAKPDSVLCSP